MVRQAFSALYGRCWHFSNTQTRHINALSVDSVHATATPRQVDISARRNCWQEPHYPTMTGKSCTQGARQLIVCMPWMQTMHWAATRFIMQSVTATCCESCFLAGADCIEISCSLRQTGFNHGIISGVFASIQLGKATTYLQHSSSAS